MKDSLTLLFAIFLKWFWTLSGELMIPELSRIVSLFSFYTICRLSYSWWCFCYLWNLFSFSEWCSSSENKMFSSSSIMRLDFNFDGKFFYAAKLILLWGKEIPTQPSRRDSVPTFPPFSDMIELLPDMRSKILAFYWTYTIFFCLLCMWVVLVSMLAPVSHCA